MELWELVAREGAATPWRSTTTPATGSCLEEFAAAFCEDGVLEIRGNEPITGRAAIIELFGGRTDRAAGP